MRRQNDARECLRKRLLEPGHTPATPRNQPHIARGSAAAGRRLREREGRFASFLTPAPSGTDLPPLATQHAGKIGSRFQSVERKVTQHFIASMSVRLHRIRCSACSGFGVHDGWNTHLKKRTNDRQRLEGHLDPDHRSTRFQVRYAYGEVGAEEIAGEYPLSGRFVEVELIENIRIQTNFIRPTDNCILFVFLLYIYYV